jgi:hypothetical protein
VVEYDNGMYLVRPAREVVYAPYYDPYVVYGPWWWPHYRPVYWSPWVGHAFVGGGAFFGHRHFRHRLDRRDHLHVRPPVAHRIPHGPTNAARFANQGFRRIPESQRQPSISSTPPVQPQSQPQPRVRGQSAGSIGAAVIRQQQKR